MNHFSVFLSVVFVVRDRAAQLESMLRAAAAAVAPIVSDYELVIVENGSMDDSVAVLRRLVAEDGLPNLQVYALTKVVDADSASWVGMSNALGDFVAVIDPFADDVGFLPALLDKAAAGADVVFANNRQKPPRSLAYRCANAIFDFAYKRFSGVHLSRDAPQFRLLSKRIVNFIHQHPQPSVTYRHLPATGGFARAYLDYSAAPADAGTKRLGDSLERGMRLLVSTTRAPMRLVTSLSLFGALANLVYSVYVVAIGLFKPDVAPGWVSLSLQQSGMFFLISLVLMVLGEYILLMATLSNEGPPYHVGQEFTSARMTWREKLNVLDPRAATSLTDRAEDPRHSS